MTIRYVNQHTVLTPMWDVDKFGSWNDEDTLHAARVRACCLIAQCSGVAMMLRYTSSCPGAASSRNAYVSRSRDQVSQVKEVIRPVGAEVLSASSNDGLQ